MSDYFTSNLAILLTSVKTIPVRNIKVEKAFNLQILLFFRSVDCLQSALPQSTTLFFKNSEKDSIIIRRIWAK